MSLNSSTPKLAGKLADEDEKSADLEAQSPLSSRAALLTCTRVGIPGYVQDCARHDKSFSGSVYLATLLRCSEPSMKV